MDLQVSQMNTNQDPFCTYNQIPLPSPYSQLEFTNEPAFIRKRNERERERVRCVNEGYERLRRHLPIDKRDKRISKVETLRAAISYIHQLQNILTDINDLKEGKNKRKPAEDTADRLPAKHRKYLDNTGVINGKSATKTTDFGKHDLDHGSLKKNDLR